MTVCLSVQFPWVLDMEPYTNEGISRMEEGEEGEAGKPRLYELVGIVVHSGQASAGHYYSFIKEKNRYVSVMRSLSLSTSVPLP